MMLWIMFLCGICIDICMLRNCFSNGKIELLKLSPNSILVLINGHTFSRNPTLIFMWDSEINPR